VKFWSIACLFSSSKSCVVIFSSSRVETLNIEAFAKNEDGSSFFPLTSLSLLATVSMANSFTHQVGGHASTILSSPLSSATLIKPSSTTELSFYTTLGPSLAGGKFTEEWCPGFYGTLQLQGKLNEEGEGLIEPLGQVEGVSIKGKGKAPEQVGFLPFSLSL